MSIRIVDANITRNELKTIAKERFGDLVKAVVDTNREIIAIGGELHADEEAYLLKLGSRQEDLWGINLYPDGNEQNRIEFDSMINLRPRQGNRSRGVDDETIREKIRQVIAKLTSN